MSKEIKQSINISPNLTTNTLNNDFKDRLVKLIPSEIITAYITILGLISGVAVEQEKISTILWIVILLLTILTSIYLILVSKVKNISQIVFSTIAFVIWVLVIASPIKEIVGLPASFLGSILLIIYTLMIPLIYQRK